MYGCEKWTPKTKDERILLAFEIICLHRVAQIEYTERITNLEVRQRLQPTEAFSATSRNSNCAGSDTSSEWSRITLDGSLHGYSPRGQPRKQWTDNFYNVKFAQLSHT